MTAVTEFCDVIRGWLNLGPDVYPDGVVTSWVRMAETDLSKDLRCKEMIQIDISVLRVNRCTLPNDWRELIGVRVVGGKPLRYTPYDDFYNPSKEWVDDLPNVYTISGNYVMVGGANPNGVEVEITYYQDIPPLNESYNWVTAKYPTLITLKTLHIASMYAIEDERGPMWESQIGKMIGSINSEHSHSKASGSALTIRHRKRGFG